MKDATRSVCSPATILVETIDQNFIRLYDSVCSIPLMHIVHQGKSDRINKHLMDDTTLCGHHRMIVEVRRRLAETIQN